LPTGDGDVNPARRAALLVWALAAVGLIAFGCCSTALSLWAGRSQDELKQALPQWDADQLAQLYPLLWPMAILVFVIGFLPGLIYLIAGFGVRSGRALPTNLALLLTITQAIVWGVLFLSGVFQAVRMGSPTNLTVNVLTFGSFLALLGFTIHWLLRAKRARQESAELATDPWNDPNP